MQRCILVMALIAAPLSWWALTPGARDSGSTRVERGRAT